MRDFFKEHILFTVFMSFFSLGFILGVSIGIAKYCS